MVTNQATQEIAAMTTVSLLISTTLTKLSSMEQIPGMPASLLELGIFWFKQRNCCSNFKGACTSSLCWESSFHLGITWNCGSKQEWFTSKFMTKYGYFIYVCFCFWEYVGLKVHPNMYHNNKILISIHRQQLRFDAPLYKKIPFITQKTRFGLALTLPPSFLFARMWAPVYNRKWYSPGTNFPLQCQLEKNLSLFWTRT